MTQCLRILAADDDPLCCRFYEETLTRLGHQVTLARTGRELVEKAAAVDAELIIADIQMPELDGLSAAAEICRRQPRPIILVSAYHDGELLERAAAEQVLAYLVKPIEEADLVVAMNLALRRFEQVQMLRAAAASLRQALEDRKVVERAKGLIMKYSRLDEESAFRRLQKMASFKNQKLIELARAILTAGELFQGWELRADDRQT